MSDLVEDISKMRDAAIGYDREVHQRSIDTIEQLQATIDRHMTRLQLEQSHTEQLQARVIVLEDIVGNSFLCLRGRGINHAIVDECYENWQDRESPPEDKP